MISKKKKKMSGSEGSSYDSSYEREVSSKYTPIVRDHIPRPPVVHDAPAHHKLRKIQCDHSNVLRHSEILKARVISLERRLVESNEELVLVTKQLEASEERNKRQSSILDRYGRFVDQLEEQVEQNKKKFS